MAEAMDTQSSQTSVVLESGTGMAPIQLSTKTQPVCLIVLGMAGSGKTSLVQRLTSDLNTLNKPPYVINLDPACHDVPYPANIGMHLIFTCDVLLIMHV